MYRPTDGRSVSGGYCDGVPGDKGRIGERKLINNYCEINRM